MAIEGFWSYVHADDDAEGGRISQLARDVVAQYEMRTGETIALFLDRDNLEWGDKWKAKVDESLASVAFFIPILTPRYFMSNECRRELNSFIRKATQLGLRELLMPILYVDWPDFHASEQADELITSVREFQWEDWTDLCFAALNSPEYRRAVAALAERLIRANVLAEQADLPAALDKIADGSDDDDDDSPGTLERIQRSLEALEEWSATLDALGIRIAVIGELSASAAGESENAPAGKEFAVRLRVLKKYASEMHAPVAEISELSQQFTNELYDVDAGIRVVIEQAATEARDGSISLSDVCSFYENIRGLAQSGETGLGATEQLVASISPIEKLSRDVRPVLRDLRKALTVLVEGREILRVWVQMMDESGIDCSDAGGNPPPSDV